jgi:hypothetical protein
MENAELRIEKLIFLHSQFSILNSQTQQCSSMVEQQAHNLKGVGSIPTTVTKLVSRQWLARRSPTPKVWVRILVPAWAFGPSFKYGVVGKLVKPQDFHS